MDRKIAKSLQQQVIETLNIFEILSSPIPPKMTMKTVV